MASQVKVRRHESKRSEEGRERKELDLKKIDEMIHSKQVEHWLKRNEHSLSGIAVPDNCVPVDPVSRPPKMSASKSSNFAKNVAPTASHDDKKVSLSETYEIGLQSQYFMQSFVHKISGKGVLGSSSDFLLRSAFFALALEYPDYDAVLEKISNGKLLKFLN